MRASKKLGSLLEEDYVEAPRISSSLGIQHSQHMRLSISGVYDDVLNISPRLSYHNPTICLERRDHGSMSFPERVLKHKLHSSDSSVTSTDTPLPKNDMIKQNNLSEMKLRERSFSEKSLKNRYGSSLTSNECHVQKPAEELVHEIADLELEVVQLERHLLSLYRRTFDQYLPDSRTNTSLIRCDPGLQVQDAKIHISQQAAHAVDSHDMDMRMNASHGQEETGKHFLHHSQMGDSCSRKSLTDTKSCCASQKRSTENDMRRSISGHRNHHSLADHLGTSIIDHVPDTCYRLSEDIVRCISAVYCKLSNSPAESLDLQASSTSSVSSSSTFSPRDPGDSWSPRSHHERVESPYLSEPLKNKHGRYSSIVEVPKICVDGDKFDYASKTLGSFRSLIRRLGTIDPRNMEHDQQLAFWLNIHNALVMHAFLAYGHLNHMKSTSLIMKAAYNVGGHSVNACVIQRVILGCQLHRPALSLRTLLTPAIKYLTGSSRHPYTLDRPEPLVHFALCLGAYSDPIVRVYTAKGIHEELKLAKAEFIQANVSVKKETRITLPKILQYYAKDASLELYNLVDMVSDSMPEAQRRLIQGCLKRKGEKCVEWSSYKLDFRYLVHRDLACA